MMTKFEVNFSVPIDSKAQRATNCRSQKEEKVKDISLGSVWILSWTHRGV